MYCRSMTDDSSSGRRRRRGMKSDTQCARARTPRRTGSQEAGACVHGSPRSSRSASGGRHKTTRPKNEFRPLSLSGARGRPALPLFASRRCVRAPALLGRLRSGVGPPLLAGGGSGAARLCRPAVRPAATPAARRAHGSRLRAAAGTLWPAPARPGGPRAGSEDADRRSQSRRPRRAPPSLPTGVLSSQPKWPSPRTTPTTTRTTRRTATASRSRRRTATSRARACVAAPPPPRPRARIACISGSGPRGAGRSGGAERGGGATESRARWPRAQRASPAPRGRAAPRSRPRPAAAGGRVSPAAAAAAGRRRRGRRTRRRAALRAAPPPPGLRLSGLAGWVAPPIAGRPRRRRERCGDVGSCPGGPPASALHGGSGARARRPTRASPPLPLPLPPPPLHPPTDGPQVPAQPAVRQEAQRRRRQEELEAFPSLFMGSRPLCGA